MAKVNWFDQSGASYAQFRPDYPPELAAALAGLAPRRDLAVDVGCGTGQLTAQLAEHFAQVVGLDPGAAQIAHARPHPRLRYQVAPAEALPLADGTADLITAAQAAHWFDRPAFYAEARRIAAPRTVIALISYGVMQIADPALNARFQHFYRDEIGPWWPPERNLVDSGYAGIDFPFTPLPAPALAITRDWDLPAFMGYLSTWSATRNARESGQEAVLTGFAQEFSALWDGPATQHRVSWPIAMRLGRL